MELSRKKTCKAVKNIFLAKKEECEVKVEPIFNKSINTKTTNPKMMAKILYQFRTALEVKKLRDNIEKQKRRDRDKHSQSRHYKRS